MTAGHVRCSRSGGRGVLKRAGESAHKTLQTSEVGLIGPRHDDNPRRAGTLCVFSAYCFRPIPQHGAIRHKSGPWGGKHHRIINCDLYLQSRLRRISVDIAHSVSVPVGTPVEEIVADVLLLEVLRQLPIDQPVPLDHVQCGAKRRTESVDHRDRPDLLANRVDDQCVALIMADRLTLPSWGGTPRVGHVEAHAADLICEVDQNDLVSLLNEFNAKLNVQCERSWFRPALVMGIRNGDAAYTKSY